MKEAYYFSHDSNARFDPKITAMRSVYGPEGYGWFWILVEMMREQTDYKLDLRSKYAYHAFASQMQCDPLKAECFVRDCVSEFGLFASDQEYVWSESLTRRMREREEKSDKARKSAEARWGKKTSPDKGSDNSAQPAQSGDDANASDSDAIKESKGKESKGNIKEPRQRKTYAEDSRYFGMAVYFRDKINTFSEEIGVGHIVANANMQNWADDFRKLVELDKKTGEEIRSVINWVTADSFWRKNVLCPETLRKKYPQLCVAMADSSRGGKGNAKGGSVQSSGHSGSGKVLSISDRELDELQCVSGQ